MPFWRCYYHLIWATKQRAPLITPQVEPVIYGVIRAKAHELESPILAMNSVVDHIHIAACIPPKLAVAEWVKHIKGASTRDINARLPNLELPFSWQPSYGALTFGARNQQFVIDYVNRQKEHHANETLEPYLEQIDDEN